MMLKVHPMERPNITDIINKLQEMANKKNVSLKTSLSLEKVKAPAQSRCKFLSCLIYSFFQKFFSLILFLILCLLNRCLKCSAELIN